MTTTTASLKGVDKEVWRKFKAEAAREGKTMARFLAELVREHEAKKEKSNWDEILSFAGSISEKEAKELREASKKVRKGFKLRTYDTDS